MTALVIVESPAKAKTIARFLGKGYRVEASFGHVRDLPQNASEIPDEFRGNKWANMGVNTEGDFEPIYVVPDSKRKQVGELRKALKDATELLLATDEDREGESISWHLLQILKPKVPVRRIVFHEITPEAIRAAVESPRTVDENLVRAQESRRILDRLYGYSLSPVLWRKVQTGLSAGRVQSVAVRLIVEREEERRAFVSSEFWDLEAAFASSTGTFRAKLARLAGKRLVDGKDFDASTGKLKARDAVLLGGDEARKLAADLTQRLPWRVARMESRPASQSPYPPFTTSTLQQEANRKLGYGAERTMRIAQRLYEGIDLGGGERVGLITYMRTDSVTLSERALAEARQQIAALYGEDFAHPSGPRRYKTKTRNAQEAHEAIRPSSLARRPQDVAAWLEPDELRVYELIWKRTIASQMADAALERTTLEIAATATDGREAIFTASGKRIQFPGFLRAYVEGSDDPSAELGDQETILPALREGQSLDRSEKSPARLGDVDAKQHATVPPARYTEASLVKKLEEEGIGRPSTYASIIATIQSRGYIFTQGRALVPTFVAMAVTHLLRRHFADYVDIKFTARLEEELDEIAEGGRPWLEHIRAFYRGGDTNGYSHHEGLQNVIAREVELIGLPDVPIGTDPGSGAAMAVRIGRYGPYVARGEGGEGNIGRVPEKVAPADYTIAMALEAIAARSEGPRALGTDPATGLTVYAANGRFGPYVQLGEDSSDKKAPKPKRASLPKGVSPDEATLETALMVLALPRELGTDPASGEPVLANNGRFGPYVQRGKEFRSVKAPDDVYTIGLERALELLAQPKFGRGAATTRTVLKDLGKTEAGVSIQVLEGRYGPYVTDGTANATVPKGTDPQSVTLEAAVALLAEKGSAPSAKKGRKSAAAARPAAAKKPAAKKATGAKKAAKKASTAPRNTLTELGTGPDGSPIRVLDGRFGPYVSDGTTNATLPKGKDPASLTLAEALAMIAKKAAKG